jgi:hypothetical protein
MSSRLIRSWLRGPRIVGPDEWSPLGIPDTEVRTVALAKQIAHLKVPDGMHPVDLYHRSAETTKVVVTLNAELSKAEGILARQRTRIANYLSEVEAQVHFGNVNSDIFARNRQYVETRLREIAPKALEQFESAYQRHSEGDPRPGLRPCCRAGASSRRSLTPYIQRRARRSWASMA